MQTKDLMVAANPQGKSAVLGPFQCMFDIPFQGLIIVHRELVNIAPVYERLSLLLVHGG
jgi:hypothetical protein